MEPQKLLRNLESFHVWVVDSAAYDRYVEEALNHAVKAVEHWIHGGPKARRKKLILRALSRLERQAYQAHGSSKLGRYEQKITNWQQKVKKWTP